MMEKSGRLRMPREKEISTRIESKKFPPEANNDVNHERSDNLCCQGGLFALTL